VILCFFGELVAVPGAKAVNRNCGIDSASRNTSVPYANRISSLEGFHDCQIEVVVVETHEFRQIVSSPTLDYYPISEYLEAQEICSQSTSGFPVDAIQEANGL
jgi:hypothetical protein